MTIICYSYKKITIFTKKCLLLIALITLIACAACIFLALWYRSVLSVRISASVFAALLGLFPFFVFFICLFSKMHSLSKENYIRKNICDFCVKIIYPVIWLATDELECGINSMFDSFSSFYDNVCSKTECSIRLENDNVFVSYFLLFIIIIYIKCDQESSKKVFDHIFSKESKIVNLLKRMFKIKNSNENTHDIFSLTNIADKDCQFLRYWNDIHQSKLVNITKDENMVNITKDENNVNHRSFIRKILISVYKESMYYFAGNSYYPVKMLLFRILCNSNSQTVINNILPELISTNLSPHDFIKIILFNEFFQRQDYQCFKACLEKMLSDGNKKNELVDYCKYYVDYVFKIVQKCYLLEEVLRFQLNPCGLLLKDDGYDDKSNTKTVKEWIIFFYNSAFLQNDKDDTCVFYYLDGREYIDASYRNYYINFMKSAEVIGEMLYQFIGEKQLDNLNLPHRIYHDAESFTEHSLSLDDELDMHKCSNDDSVTLDESSQLNEEKRCFYDEKSSILHNDILNLPNKVFITIDKMISLLNYDYKSSVNKSEGHNKNYDKTMIVALCCISNFAAQVICEELDSIISQVEKEDFSEELKCNILKIKEKIFNKNIADKLQKYDFGGFIAQMSCISEEISAFINTMKYDEANYMEELQKCETAAGLLSNHINTIQYMNQTISDKIQEVVISYTDRVMIP